MRFDSHETLLEAFKKVTLSSKKSTRIKESANQGSRRKEGGETIDQGTIIGGQRKSNGVQWFEYFSSTTED